MSFGVPNTTVWGFSQSPVNFWYRLLCQKRRHANESHVLAFSERSELVSVWLLGIGHRASREDLLLHSGRSLKIGQLAR